ncbi:MULTISPECIES: hypothetical protein [Bradyrhizobium]|uniref:hypothetical protein n=1 Tax=Bradyrhizobium TaxID=374 RepID=UPI000231CB5F|nr:hypothetical protein [Bradyrhizobium japonicum]MCS3533938.1 putative DNA-binding transcriptional regulator AlpA [Bradyrhizobium japonicum]MCS3989968.1 putative DNA-binding transcriptional regulator AlpA [Bradyrhizobium japonicum]MCS4015219.1 putative DNA-binding transcriptional regulator AlpA [Bradyrhizobium japonicum]MCS4202313.1 putative DNA-binding transcriptional regulator AlpA [Bradyrhizobium japonicum]MDH6174551.1 putative DNA-binding transcriptional regulator AlpA [Bradyrhizobium jap
MGSRKSRQVLHDENNIKPPQPRLALTIREFCEAHRISQGMFYKLKKQGLTPTEMRLGTRSVISLEAAAVWRAQREAMPNSQK